MQTWAVFLINSYYIDSNPAKCLQNIYEVETKAARLKFYTHDPHILDMS